MNTELKAFIEEFTNKTGMSIFVYQKNELNLQNSLDEIYLDQENNCTLFPFLFKGENLIGKIEGTMESNRAIAFLFKSLAENSLSTELKLDKSEFLRRVIFGEMGYAQYRRLAQKYQIPNSPCFVMLIGLSSAVKFEDLSEVMANYGDRGMDFALKVKEGECVFIKFIDEDSKDYTSATEYGEYLSCSVYEELGETLAISIGGVVKNPFELSVSYSQAVSALRMGETLGIKGGIHSYSEYALVKILEDMPKYKLNEYIAILAQESSAEIFSDKEMTDTAEAFLENNLNVSETARILYLHRNTLTYRLDKIQKHTGLDLRKFSDAVTFRLMTILFKLSK